MSQELLVLLPRTGELSEIDELDEEMQAELAAEHDAYQYRPPIYKVASGTVRRFQNVNDENELLPTLVGVVLMSKIARALWDDATGNETGADADRPRCTSLGGIEGVWRQDDGQSVTVRCLGCPWNEFGTAVDKKTKQVKRGKACAERRRFVMLLAGHRRPIMVSLPTMSCAPWDRYASTLDERGSHYALVVTEISLAGAENADGQSYSVAQFKQVERLSREQKALVGKFRRLYRELLGLAPEYREYSDGVQDHPPDLDDPDAYSTAAAGAVEDEL